MKTVIQIIKSHLSLLGLLAKIKYKKPFMCVAHLEKQTKKGLINQHLVL